MGSISGQQLQKINRQNRESLKNATNKKGIVNGERGELKFKEPSKKEYTEWKENYEKRRKKQRATTIIIAVITTIFVTLLFYWLGLFN